MLQKSYTAYFSFKFVYSDKNLYNYEFSSKLRTHPLYYSPFILVIECALTDVSPSLAHEFRNRMNHDVGSNPQENV